MLGPMVASPSSELAELAAGLSRAVGRFRRSLNRRVRAGAGTPSLPEAQLEILRLVDRRPGLRVHDVATELRLASNTVSTLVRQLADSGLVERIPDSRRRPGGPSPPPSGGGAAAAPLA